MAESSHLTQEPLMFLEALLEHAPTGFAFVDREFRFLRINERLAAWNGLSVAAHLGKTVREVVPQLWPTLEPFYRQALSGKRLTDENVRGLASDGSPGSWVVTYYPISVRGECIGVGVVVDDVTERRRAEDELRARNALYAMLAGTNRAINRCVSREELFRDLCRLAVELGKFRFAWVGAPDGRDIKVIAAAGDDQGYLSKVRISADPSDPLADGPTGRCARRGEVVVVNDFLASPLTKPWHEEGQRAGFGASAAFPLFERGAVTAVLTLYATTRDFFTEDLVTTIKELTPSVSYALDGLLAARAREKSESELGMRDRAIQALEQGIVIADVRHRDRPIVYASPGFTVLTGYPVAEALGRNCRFLQGPETDLDAIAQLRELVRRSSAGSVELLNYRKDGTTFWNRVSLSPVRDGSGEVTHFVGVQSDVSERRAIETRLRQAAKLDAVGRLAAGVAHDFNNLLAVILSYSNLALSDLGVGTQLHDDLSEIRQAGERAAELTQQLLAFTRQQVSSPRVIELSELVRGLEKMLGRLLGESIELLLLLPKGCRVSADQTQLEQIVMNLALNARDAMPRGGTLTIEASTCDVTESPGPSALAVPPGRYVVLSVTDTGEGMSPAVRERIFEPFFTTKEKGKGTGLGLATVFGIVSQSKGHVEVKSEPSRGTHFTIYLPRVDREVDAPEVSQLKQRHPGGTETILLVEDDVQVRGATHAVLARHGYLVLDATNGGDAFLIVEQHPGPIDLLLSDIVMPRISGYDLAKRLVKQRPTLKVLLMSGYVEDPQVREALEGTLLQKPFTPEALLQAARNLLDAPKEEGLGG